MTELILPGDTVAFTPEALERSKNLRDFVHYHTLNRFRVVAIRLYPHKSFGIKLNKNPVYDQSDLGIPAYYNVDVFEVIQTAYHLH